MTSYLQRILQAAPLIWATLIGEIIVTSLTYAVLSTFVLSKSTSFLISLCLAIALILLVPFILPRLLSPFRNIPWWPALSYQGVRTIREKVLESDRPDRAIALNNLATLYKAQGKYDQ